MIQRCRFSADEFQQMIRAGVFDRRAGKIELIEGEVFAVSPASEEHVKAVSTLTRWSIDCTAEDEFEIRVQGSLPLPALESVPEPDIAWVRADDARRGYPSAAEVVLVIEVSVTSGDFDRGPKSQIYARAGIPEYWLVDIPSQSIEVRRDPQGDRYARVALHRSGETISPGCKPEARLAVSRLFPA